MVSFLFSIGVLILGYFSYGKFVEKLFGVDENRETPAARLKDGVDYMPLPTWRVKKNGENSILGQVNLP